MFTISKEYDVLLTGTKSVQCKNDSCLSLFDIPI